MPILSIIINVLNGEKFIQDTLNSIFTQKYQKYEIIVWDNGSTDSTPSIVRHYEKKIRYFRIKKTEHLGMARAMALTHAKGRYVTFLDSDDRLLQNSLIERIKLLEKGFDLVYGGQRIINTKGLFKKEIKIKEKNKKPIVQLLSYYDIASSSAMFRKNIITKNHIKFMKRFHFCPDYYLFLDIASQYRIGITQNSIIEIRKGTYNWTYKLRRFAGTELITALRLIKKNLNLRDNEVKKSYLTANSKAKIYYAFEQYLKNKPLNAKKILLQNNYNFITSKILWFAMFMKLPASVLEYLLKIKDKVSRW